MCDGVCDINVLRTLLSGLQETTRFSGNVSHVHICNEVIWRFRDFVFSHELNAYIKHVYCSLVMGLTP